MKNKIKSYTKHVLELSSICEQFVSYEKLFDQIRSGYIGKYRLIPVFDFTLHLKIYLEQINSLIITQDVKEIINFLENNYVDCLIDLNK